MRETEPESIFLIGVIPIVEGHTCEEIIFSNI